MGFPKDRTGWKKPGPRITAQRYDEIIAAIRAEPNALESIARRFDVGTEVIRRLAPKVGVAPSMINEGGVVTVQSPFGRPFGQPATHERSRSAASPPYGWVSGVMARGSDG